MHARLLLLGRHPALTARLAAQAARNPSVRL